MVGPGHSTPHQPPPVVLHFLTSEGKINAPQIGSSRAWGAPAQEQCPDGDRRHRRRCPRSRVDSCPRLVEWGVLAHQGPPARRGEMNMTEFDEMHRDGTPKAPFEVTPLEGLDVEEEPEQVFLWKSIGGFTRLLKIRG